MPEQATVAIAGPARARLSLRDLARRLPRLRVCIALYAISVAALFLSPLGHGWPFVDLAVYRLGGKAILSGAHLYRLRFPGALAFPYPPLSAMAFTLLAPLRLGVLKPLMSAGSIVLLPAMLCFALRLPPMSSRMSRKQAARLALLAAAA